MRHFWIERFLNEQKNGFWIAEGPEELTELMDELIEDAGNYLNVNVTEYHMYESVNIRNNTFGNEIKLMVDPGYTEAEMVEAGLIDPTGIQLNPNVWGDLGIDKSLVDSLDYRRE
jgi:hypothetical protein